MNKEQKNYILAKAYLDTLREEEFTIGQNYIREHYIKNDDGSTPSRIYDIDDDEIYDKAINECCKLLETCGLEAKINEANELLKKAEEALIKFGLDIFSKYYPKQKENLENGIKNNYTHRLKMIDLILKLDVSTIK